MKFPTTNLIELQTNALALIGSPRLKFAVYEFDEAKIKTGSFAIKASVEWIPRSSTPNVHRTVD